MFYFIFILHSYRILSRSLAGHECSVNGSAMYMTETYLFTISTTMTRKVNMHTICRFLAVGNIFRLETCMNSLVKVPPYSTLNFQRKMFFTQNWCNITLKLYLTRLKGFQMTFLTMFIEESVCFILCEPIIFAIILNMWYTRNIYNQLNIAHEQ
jgi:hypothetical protein